MCSYILEHIFPESGRFPSLGTVFDEMVSKNPNTNHESIARMTLNRYTGNKTVIAHREFAGMLKERDICLRAGKTWNPKMYKGCWTNSPTHTEVGPSISPSHAVSQQVQDYDCV